MMSTKEYIMPAIKAVKYGDELMDLGINSGEGDGNMLGKEATFDEAAEKDDAGLPKQFRSVWEE